MKTNLNKVELIGYAGMDAEVKEVKKGVKIGRFSLATSEGYKNTKGEWVNTTTWHRIVLWNDIAKRAADAVKKGSKVSLTGKINYRFYETLTGEKKMTAEIVANALDVINE